MAYFIRKRAHTLCSEIHLSDDLRHRLVTAEGTTLGGDDGIGVAFMMAYMTDKQAKHPALECVFTADEETTMNGGIHLDYSQFKAKY